MQIRELRGHNFLGAPEKPRVIRRLWDFRLRRGEHTRHRLQSDAEEIYIILAGRGRMTVGGTSGDVREGEVIYVPPRVEHHIENVAGGILRGLSIEAMPPLPGEEGAEHSASGTQAGAAGAEASSEAGTAHPHELDRILERLGEAPGESEAIRAIVELFDVSGALSERIEEALGLDNELGSEALRQLERKLMDCVVEIADRYRSGRGFRRRWWE